MALMRLINGLTEGSWCEVEQVQSSVEELIEETHESQYRSVGVVNMHDGVLVHVDEFVRGLALQNRSVIEIDKSANLGIELLSLTCVSRTSGRQHRLTSIAGTRTYIWGRNS